MANAQTFAALFAESDAHYANIIKHQTWGHMAADVGRYSGTILFCVSEYCSGSCYLITTEFQNKVDQGPWFYDAANDFINRDRSLVAGVYLATCTYVMYKNGVNKVLGKAKRIAIKGEPGRMPTPSLIQEGEVSHE